MRGVGLHSGQEITLTIHPGQDGEGIMFRRVDLPGRPVIPARYDSVFSTHMATSLGVGKTVVGTVEHLMAAFSGFGIDSAWVELDGPEVPVFDGSSKVFAELLDAAGSRALESSKKVLLLKRKVERRVGDKWAVAEPSGRFELHASIDWDHPAIGFQEFHYFEGKTPFREIVSSRTFGFLADVEKLKSMGLARGGSLDNAIVLDEAGVINETGLRYPDEFVRHKVLDAVGDLKLAGVDLRASIRLHRGGHELHTLLIKDIFSSPDNYEIVSAESLIEFEVKRAPRSAWPEVARSSRLAAV